MEAALACKNKAELLKLIADLYSLSADNKSFVHSRYAIGKDTLEPYKAIISESLYPDVRKDGALNLSAGRKAISDYFKATKNKIGRLELMVHYFEMGHQFTLDCGDID